MRCVSLVGTRTRVGRGLHTNVKAGYPNHLDYEGLTGKPRAVVEEEDGAVEVHRVGGSGADGRGRKGSCTSRIRTGGNILLRRV